MRRQRLNVDRMRLLGAEVVPVDAGSRTLKDAINEALRDWVTNVRTTHYILGSVLGPDPYPRMVRDFHRVIGEEARAQLKQPGAGAERPTSRSPASAAAATRSACSRAFLDDPRVRLIGVEAGGRGSALRRARGALRRRQRSASSTAPARWCCRTRTARSRPPTRSRPASTTRRSAPSTSGCATSGRVEYTLGDRRRGGRGLPPARAHRGHPARARERARARRGDQARAARCRASDDRAGQPLGPRRQGRRVGAGVRPRAAERGEAACEAGAAPGRAVRRDRR